MRIRVLLHKVEPDQYDWPEECPYEGCRGHRFKAHGVRGEKRSAEGDECATICLG